MARTSFVPPRRCQSRRAAAAATLLLRALVPCCLGLAACSKPPPPPAPLVTTPEPSPVATSTPLPTPAPTPPPSPSSTPTPTPEVTPTPTLAPAHPVPVVVRELAPTGVYYVIRDASVRIPGGLIGVSAGDQVTLVSEHGNKLIVSNGRDDFELDKSQVTNDPKASATLAEHARAAQAAADQFQAKQDALRRQQEAEEIEFLQAHPLATPRGAATP